MTVKTPSLTLEAFLKLPETKPASEYLDGEMIQKPVPKTRHSRLHGCQLGWLVDPRDRSVIIFQPQQQPEFCHQQDRLIVLAGIELELTAERVFGWLKMKV